MTTQQHLSAGLKKSYDIELTRELCPPKETYQTCKFKKRLVVHKDKIHIIDPITREPLQPREEINLTQNVIEIKTSFKYRGWLHSEEPLFVQVAADGNFILRSGFNRYKAATESGWEYLLVDVYEDAPVQKDNIAFKYVCNNTNLPSKPNKDIDFIRGVVEAIDANAINQEVEEEIISFLKQITSTDDGMRLKTDEEIVNYVDVTEVNDDGSESTIQELSTSCLLYKVYRQRGKNRNILPLDGKGANQILNSLGKGWAGARNKDVTELGYCFEKKTTCHRILWDGMKLYNKYQTPIMLYGYIENPSSMTLKSDRVETLARYEWFIEECVRRFTDSLDYHKMGLNFMELEWKFREIFQWGGFIPQDKTPHCDESGRIVEL